MAAKLNEYVWGMYKASFEGQLSLAYFDRLDNFEERAELLQLFMGVGNWITSHSDETSEWENIPLDESDLLYITAVKLAAEKYSVSNLEQVFNLLTELVSKGDVQLSEAEDDILTLEDPFANLSLLSLGLHLAHPEIFIPYGFTGRYYLVPKIAEAFGIPLAKIPPKNDHLGRWLYYGLFCIAFQEFRKLHEMTIPEMLAFIYDFSIEYIYSNSEKDLPEPRNAWLLIGGTDNGDLDWLDVQEDIVETRWQGNLDMRRGDTCIMYIRSPMSAVHSSWRVIEDAYEDPFFHYKHAVQIGQPVRLPALRFREIASDPLWAGNQYIKANFQGASGKALTHGEYERLLQMLNVRSELPEGIPHFVPRANVDLASLANERDVEIHLVEPLLKRAGLESSDWVRQLSVRMGRGERIYPDYAIGLIGKPPEQRVRALIEVKYRAAGERDWREAFFQVKSYGLRLGARVILTAAAEGVRIYVKSNDDFDFDSGQEYTWSDLQEGETLRNLGRLMTEK
ncbi:hypothetical protein [Deinococcus sp.]|uniref:hypothetical protein n=1 Tax=Deinococcus sp. TaxID=47478 RepID=UPI003C7BEFF8